MTDEIIIDYVSDVGNNDVPYPYAIGETNVYLMIENVYFPKNICTIAQCYMNYYGHVINKLFDKNKVKKINRVVVQENF